MPSTKETLQDIWISVYGLILLEKLQRERGTKELQKRIFSANTARKITKIAHYLYKHILPEQVEPGVMKMAPNAATKAIRFSCPIRAT